MSASDRKALERQANDVVDRAIRDEGRRADCPVRGGHRHYGFHGAEFMSRLEHQFRMEALIARVLGGAA